MTPFFFFFKTFFRKIISDVSLEENCLLIFCIHRINLMKVSHMQSNSIVTKKKVNCKEYNDIKEACFSFCLYICQVLLSHKYYVN